jgi:endo-1,4-beta-xylanase
MRSMKAVALLATAATAFAALVGAGSPASAQPSPRQSPEPAASSHGFALRAAPLAARVRVGTELTQADTANPSLLNLVATDFSSVTPDYAFRWTTEEPEPGATSLEQAESVASWAHSNGLGVRGSLGVWDHPGKYPSYLDSDYQSGGSAAVAADLQEHIRAEMTPFAPGGDYAGDVTSWNAVNEPLTYTSPSPALSTGSIFDEALGPLGYIDAAFRDAYAVDPTANLCLNEDGVTGISKRSTYFYDLVAHLLHAGVPINCIGFETHLSLDAPLTGHVTEARVSQNLNRFAALPTPSGQPLDLQITELDIRLPSNGVTPVSPQLLERQALAYADVMHGCLSVPTCSSVTTWGIDDGESWVPGHYRDCALPAGQQTPNGPVCGAALLLDSRYRPKPAYNSVLEALGTRASAEITRTGGQLRGKHQADQAVVGRHSPIHTDATVATAGEYAPSITAAVPTPGGRATLAFKVDGRTVCTLRVAGVKSRTRACPAVELAPGTHRVVVRQRPAGVGHRHHSPVSIAALGLSPITPLARPAGATSGKRRPGGWRFTRAGSLEVLVNSEQDSDGLFRIDVTGGGVAPALELSVDGTPWTSVRGSSGTADFRGVLTAGEHVVSIGPAQSPQASVTLRHLIFEPD